MGSTLCVVLILELYCVTFYMVSQQLKVTKNITTEFKKAHTISKMDTTLSHQAKCLAGVLKIKQYYGQCHFKFHLKNPPEGVLMFITLVIKDDSLMQ